MSIAILLWSCALILSITAQTFTIIGGQIFTPGLAIIDAPQPNTPLGGDILQVAIDISGDGKLQQPPYPANAPTRFFNITIFLSSYITGLNLTITNGTAGSGNASLGDILAQEPGSTVKHVNWIWPDCFVGNGPPAEGSNSARGAYNISIHQSYTLNSTSYYTIFDLPILVTNSISSTSSSGTQRPSCSSLNNTLLSPAVLASSADTIPQDEYPWTNGDSGAETVVSAMEATSTSTSTSISTSTSTTGDAGATTVVEIVMTTTAQGVDGEVTTITMTSSVASSSATDFGDTRPDATPEDGLGAGVVLRPGGLIVMMMLAGLAFILLR